MAAAQGVGRRPAPAADPDAVAYNALARVDQKVLRRTVRMGRPLASPEEAGMAVAFARYQRSQPWYRLFWVLFAPGVVISVVIASRLHLAVVGVVLAIAAQGAWGWRSLRRVERINRHLLTGPA
ncbi:MAG: hypothetical protein H0U41_08310 [Actinobacteria bacterium]|nr:hypothetical protein [Actinomycetota bacterium]